MLSKILFSLTLAISPVVSISNQIESTDFDTYQIADKYLQDFDYLNENSYRLSTALNGQIDYTYQDKLFYAFPVNYDIKLYGNFKYYYSNANYNFVNNSYDAYEVVFSVDILNYIGSETEMPFLALDTIGMSQVIEYDKEQEHTDKSIYTSFYRFFTGFFPLAVVQEYHGIFTFIVVAFLLFLVFGFVFFLFRVIRRLVGFK